MRGLIQLFFRYGGFFLFLLLEGLCLFLVVQFNKEQKAIFFNSLSAFSLYLEDKSDAITTHFSLEEQVDSLMKENARYKQILINYNLEYTDWETFVTDDEPFQQYTLQEAKIKQNTTNKSHNYLILDKGKDDGIEKHSAVISDHGAVGIVIEVNNTHCLVMSLLHRQTKISTALKSKNAHGSLVWKEESPLKMNLENIPKHISVEKGDTITTSGRSAMFPEGLMVGIVDSSWVESGSSSLTIPVRLSNDLSTLKYVYIVTNLMKGDQEELDKKIQDE